MVRRIAVTGGAGNITYSLLFRLAREPIALHILEIPEALKALEGVVMELQDCAFSNLHEIRTGSDPVELFGDIDLAILVGAQPRTKGMERKDLLQRNAQIFVEQGKALNASASRDAKVLVVGNPCNTNAWITRHYAPHLDVHAMTRLDQNRATAQLALKTGKQVTNLTIWGNHSSTQVPDFTHALVDGQPAPASPELEPIVQKRGAAIIEARGKSSAASAANAILDAIHDLDNPTPHFSSAVYSEKNSYGIDPDLMFSFPLRSTGSWNWEIIPDISWDSALEAKIRATEAELIEERDQVRSVV